METVYFAGGCLWGTQAFNTIQELFKQKLEGQMERRNV